jgi:hypothetical protein
MHSTVGTFLRIFQTFSKDYGYHFKPGHIENPHPSPLPSLGGGAVPIRIILSLRPTFLDQGQC